MVTPPKTADAKRRQIEGARKARQQAKINRRAKKKRKPDADQWERIHAADIITFATDPDFLGLTLFPSQEVFLRAQYGLPIPDDLIPLYQQMTHLEDAPEGVPNRNETVYEPEREKGEGCVVGGVRGGKSTVIAVIALYEATRPHWAQYLQKGEPGYVIHIATTKQQTMLIIGSMTARMLDQCGDVLKDIVEVKYQEEIHLVNGMRIKSFPTRSTSFLGLPCICAILDECAHFYQETGSQREDQSIFEALRTRTIQFQGLVKFFLLSNPEAKSGVLWNWYKDGSQVPNRLTVQAPTWVMNPTISEEFLEERRKETPETFERFYGARFCERVESLYSEPMIESVMTLYDESPARAGFEYVGGLDASGLSGRDRFAFSIAHKDERNQLVQDVKRSWDTIDPDEIFDEIETLCRSYGVMTVWIDQYAKGYVRHFLEKRNLLAEVRPSLANVHVNLKNLMLGGKVSLIKDPELTDGLLNTRIYYSRSNNPTVGHPQSAFGHGDLADACASAIWGASVVEDDGELVEINQIGLQTGIVDDAGFERYADGLFEGDPSLEDIA